MSSTMVVKTTVASRRETQERQYVNGPKEKMETKTSMVKMLRSVKLMLSMRFSKAIDGREIRRTRRYCSQEALGCDLAREYKQSRRHGAFESRPS